MKKSIVILIFGLIFFLTVDSCISDGVRSFYCLSEDKCITVWKRTDGEVYIIFGEYKEKKVPKDNYIRTSYDNALTIIVDESSSYDYIISNDYGKKLLIKSSNYKTKYYEYGQKETFINDYYINRQIKKGLQYLQIDIKESLVVINGVKL